MTRTNPLAAAACCLFAATLPLASSSAKLPPKSTSTIGTPMLRAPSELKPGEYFLYPEVAPSGPMVLVVSLPQQIGYVYRNGVLIGATTVSTGKKGHETPTGVFTILQKHADHYSSIYDSAPMPYMQRLTWSGVALHAGRLPGYPASHGCIRMPYDFAEKLFSQTSTGITVVVSDEKQFPSTVAYPGLFAPVDIKGQVVVEPAIDGDHAWQPELSTEGPITILVTGEDRRIRVFRNGVQIGWSLFQLDDPTRSLPLGVYTRLEDPVVDPAAAAPATKVPRWMVVAGDDNIIVTGEQLLAGISAPEEFVTQVSAILSAGATLVVTRLPASGDTTGIEMTVIDAEQPAGN